MGWANSMKIAYKEHMDGGNPSYEVEGLMAWPIWAWMGAYINMEGPIKEAPIQI